MRGLGCYSSPRSNAINTGSVLGIVDASTLIACLPYAALVIVTAGDRQRQIYSGDLVPVLANLTSQSHFYYFAIYVKP